MKQNTRKLNLFVTLTLLLLAIVCVCNVTYAYFTSTSKSEGDMVFSGLDAKFVYQTSSGGIYQTAASSTLNLYSASGTISRGVPFNLSLSKGGSAISSLGIQNLSTSCSAYVRFWIDAYALDGEGRPITTVNYGKYFVLPTSQFYTQSDCSVAQSRCYFGIDVLLPDEATALPLGNTLTLQDLSDSDAFPIELMGSPIQISISYELVQSSNKAYLAAFGEYGDEKGYYTKWS